jgi:hypothetical protein
MVYRNRDCCRLFPAFVILESMPLLLSYALRAPRTAARLAPGPSPSRSKTALQIITENETCATRRSRLAAHVRIELRGSRPCHAVPAWAVMAGITLAPFSPNGPLCPAFAALSRTPGPPPNHFSPTNPLLSPTPADMLERGPDNPVCCMLGPPGPASYTFCNAARKIGSDWYIPAPCFVASRDQSHAQPCHHHTTRHARAKIRPSSGPMGRVLKLGRKTPFL